MTPILLNKSRTFEEEEVWKLLCGRVDSEWKRRIGAEGFNKGSIYETILTWANALLQELTASKNQVEVSELLARVFRYAELVMENQTAYAWPTEKERNRKYWPTLTSEIIYKENFCYKQKPFISRNTKIASAGTDFALMMRRWCAEWKYNYLVTEQAPANFSEKQKERFFYQKFSARYGYHFNAPSIRQLVERAFRLWEPKPLLYQYRGNASDMSDDGMWFDPYRDGVHFTSPDEWSENHPVFQEALEQMVREADVFVLTLDANEAWYFLHDGSYLSRMPWNLVSGLLDKKVFSLEENLAELERLREVWMNYNPTIRFIVSVSSVPLTSTFQRDRHIAVASHYGKCVLRCAAAAFAERHSNVDYFPSFEAVMYGSPVSYQEDGRHPSLDAEARFMRMFREAFCTD